MTENSTFSPIFNTNQGPQTLEPQERLDEMPDMTNPRPAIPFTIDNNNSNEETDLE